MARATATSGRTVVEEVTDTLCLRIASHLYPPRTMLPSVRQLADEFGISRPTAQQVLGRVEAIGFAHARRGLGFEVADLDLYGGLDTLGHLFRFASTLPGTAAQILGDVLEVERILLLHTLRTVFADPGGYDTTPVRRAVEAFARLTSLPDVPVTDLLRAEFHILRVLMAALGQRALLGIVNSGAEIIEQIPEIATSVYVLEPAAHAQAFRIMVELWDRHRDDPGQPPIDLDLIETLLRQWALQVVDRFARILEESGPQRN